MKIDETCIEHNALQIINYIVACPNEYNEQDETADHCRLLTIGAVRGVLDMAEVMKRVLKV